MLRKSSFVLLLILLSKTLTAQINFEKSLYLEGTENYIEVPDAPSLNFKSDYTIELWIKPETIEQVNLLCKIEENTGWALNLNQSQHPLNNDLRVYPGNPILGGYTGWPGDLSYLALWYDSIDTRGHGHRMGRDTNLPLGKWTHVALTLNLGRIAYFYINGTLYNVGSKSDSYWYGMQAPGIPLRIGYCPDAWDMLTGLFGIYFYGYIDEVRIWTRERRGPEIRSTMNEPLDEETCMFDSDLRAYYRFDEFEDLDIGDDGQADDIRDWSSYGNHGDLVGYADLIDNSVLANVESESNEIPDKYTLLQNYPNPFNASTTISYYLPKSTFVTLKIYNVMGEEIETLISGYQPEGMNKVAWDARDLPGGFYICRLITEEFTRASKLLLQK